MRRLAIHPTLPTRFLRVAFVLGSALVLAALAAAPASAHAEKKAGKYAFVVGFGDEPAYAGQPNSLQVIISRDGKPATDLAGQLDKLKAHLYYGARSIPRRRWSNCRWSRTSATAGAPRATTGRSSSPPSPAATPSTSTAPWAPRRSTWRSPAAPRPSATSTTRPSRPSRRSRTRPPPSSPSGWTVRRPG